LHCSGCVVDSLAFIAEKKPISFANITNIVEAVLNDDFKRKWSLEIFSHFWFQLILHLLLCKLILMVVQDINLFGPIYFRSKYGIIHHFHWIDSLFSKIVTSLIY